MHDSGAASARPQRNNEILFMFPPKESIALAETAAVKSRDTEDRPGLGNPECFR
jgi:hypothetical protein